MKKEGHHGKGFKLLSRGDPKPNWFGGKSKVAHIVWQAFGNVPNFVEPFFGSGAVLLGRPEMGKIETVNDLDGFVCNFWRAVKHDPEQVASYADYPVNENDLHARHIWLVSQKETLSKRLEGDIDYFDAKIAGFWVWGICCWIGGGFCSGNGPWISVDGKLQKKDNDAGKGVNRQLIHLGNAGTGVNRKLIHLGDAGKGLLDWMQSLSNRLRFVRVASGDWTRVLGPSVTRFSSMTGVFLDPPYDTSMRSHSLYNEDASMSDDVFAWCMVNGDNKMIKIALCGYEGEYNFPDTWQKFEWKSGGGYLGGQSSVSSENREKERIWFSPSCNRIEKRQLNLFG